MKAGSGAGGLGNIMGAVSGMTGGGRGAGHVAPGGAGGLMYMANLAMGALSKMKK